MKRIQYLMVAALAATALAATAYGVYIVLSLIAFAQADLSVDLVIGHIQGRL